MKQMNNNKMKKKMIQKHWKKDKDFSRKMISILMIQQIKVKEEMILNL